MHLNHKIFASHSCREFFSRMGVTGYHDLPTVDNVVVDTSAVYFVDRELFFFNIPSITHLVEQQGCQVILCDPYEGSETILWMMENHQAVDLILRNHIPVISGGDFEPAFSNLRYENFLVATHDHNRTLPWEQYQAQLYSGPKPYTFAFLNGRGRIHRRCIAERLRDLGLLDRALWSWLDQRRPIGRRENQLTDQAKFAETTFPIQLLHPDYELSSHQREFAIGSKKMVKDQLMEGAWGDGIIIPRLYTDTYFSVVTETVFAYPYSFRTEKIWKPVLMGHPWIVLANTGFVRDMRNLGFRSFAGLIDESYDQIENNQQRLDRVVHEIQHLCSQDLDEFARACQDICVHNRQHAQELYRRTTGALASDLQSFLDHHYP
jgi:hypothetical protein